MQPKFWYVHTSKEVFNKVKNIYSLKFDNWKRSWVLFCKSLAALPGKTLFLEVKQKAQLDCINQHHK